MHRADDTPPRDARRDVDERLDEALEETFPASDPIAVSPEPDAAGTHAVLTVGHSTRPIAATRFQGSLQLASASASRLCVW